MSETATATLTMSRDVTGQDRYIIAQALHVAAKALLAEPFPEESDAQNMREILEAVWPGSLMRKQLEDRVQDGLWMGLHIPIGGVTLDAENVEAWLAAGLADGDPPEVLLEAATIDTIQMADHLSGRTRLPDLTDHDVRVRLMKARATIRVLSVPAPVCPSSTDETRATRVAG